jgi:hypothetical protein
MKHKNTKKSDNTWLLVLLGALGVGGTVGLVAWARSRSEGVENTIRIPEGSEGESATLAETAASIREEVLTVKGCAVSWKSGEASRTTLLSHINDFFVPALADARDKGATTVDEITAHIASLLVAGCPWPPTVLESFNIDDALAGKLSGLAQQAWTVAESQKVVQFYLTIRQVVTGLANEHRRG